MSQRALGRQFATIPVEGIRKGMMVRPSWGDFPFERAMGNAVHDPDHPSSEGGKMYVIPHARRFSPHQPEGTPYHVLLRRKK